MRVGGGNFARIADLHLVEKMDRRFERLFLAAALVGAPGFGHLPADVHHRVQRVFRILKDEARPLAADLAHLLFRGREYIDAVEGEAVGGDGGIGG
ncbi:hypothetical protein D3C87_1722830 [compost metagenome]